MLTSFNQLESSISEKTSYATLKFVQDNGFRIFVGNMSNSRNGFERPLMILNNNTDQMVSVCSVCVVLIESLAVLLHRAFKRHQKLVRQVKMLYQTNKCDAIVSCLKERTNPLFITQSIYVIRTHFTSKSICLYVLSTCSHFKLGIIILRPFISYKIDGKCPYT